MNDLLLNFFSKIIPQNIKPILRPLKHKIFPKTKPPSPIILFDGWGMTTEHEIPWKNDLEFQKTHQIYKETFNHDGVGLVLPDELLWRHWNVTFCIRYVLKFTNPNSLNFVECGTASGSTAFFALSSLKKIPCIFHLYDSWGVMKSEYLLDSEQEHVGDYKNQNIQNTKKNLQIYSDKIKYHIGYIPETFDQDSPDEIIYLHIDVNSAKTTMEILEFFYPKLLPNGIILFDDYGWTAYSKTKELVDTFLNDKDGIIHLLSTGQAIFFKSKN